MRPGLTINRKSDIEWRIIGESGDLININASGQICNFSPLSTHLHVQQKPHWGYLLWLSDDGPKLLTEQLPTRKVNWLRNGQIVWADYNFVSIWELQELSFARVGQSSQAPVTYPSQFELSTHTDYPLFWLGSILASDGLLIGNRVICYDYKHDVWGEPWELVPARQGFPVHNNEVYPYGWIEFGLIGAKEAGTPNRWQEYNLMTGEYVVQLPPVGRSHPALSQDDNNAVCSGFNGGVLCETLETEPFQRFTGIRHQHGCFRYPKYICSELHQSEPRDTRVRLLDVLTGANEILTELTPHIPQSFSDWTTPTISPDNKWAAWQDYDVEAKRIGITVVRLEEGGNGGGEDPLPPPDVQQQIDALEKKVGQIGDLVRTMGEEQGQNAAQLESVQRDSAANADAIESINNRLNSAGKFIEDGGRELQ